MMAVSRKTRSLEQLLPHLEGDEPSVMKYKAFFNLSKHTKREILLGLLRKTYAETQRILQICQEAGEDIPNLFDRSLWSDLKVHLTRKSLSSFVNNPPDNLPYSNFSIEGGLLSTTKKRSKGTLRSLDKLTRTYASRITTLHLDELHLSKFLSESAINFYSLLYSLRHLSIDNVLLSTGSSSSLSPYSRMLVSLTSFSVKRWTCEDKPLLKMFATEMFFLVGQSKYLATVGLSVEGELDLRAVGFFIGLKWEDSTCFNINCSSLKPMSTQVVQGFHVFLTGVAKCHCKVRITGVSSEFLEYLVCRSGYSRVEVKEFVHRVEICGNWNPGLNWTFKTLNMGFECLKTINVLAEDLFQFGLLPHCIQQISVYSLGGAWKSGRDLKLPGKWPKMLSGFYASGISLKDSQWGMLLESFVASGCDIRTLWMCLSSLNTDRAFGISLEPQLTVLGLENLKYLRITFGEKEVNPGVPILTLLSGEIDEKSRILSVTELLIELLGQMKLVHLEFHLNGSTCLPNCLPGTQITGEGLLALTSGRLKDSLVHFGMKTSDELGTLEPTVAEAVEQIESQTKLNKSLMYPRNFKTLKKEPFDFIKC